MIQMNLFYFQLFLFQSILFVAIANDELWTKPTHNRFVGLRSRLYLMNEIWTISKQQKQTGFQYSYDKWKNRKRPLP